MLFIFPILFCFSFFDLELQHSDDAGSALWVCSSAGAAQRCPPSNQNGGKRKQCEPHTLTPFGQLVADLSPITTSLAPKCPSISDRIGFSKALIFTETMSPIQSRWFIGCLFPNASHVNVPVHSLVDPRPAIPLNLRYYGCWVCASLVFQVSCQGLLGLHLAIQRARQR